jgi:hypothetical protein
VKRYTVNLTGMQWGMIAMDLGKLEERSESSAALVQIVKLILDHVEFPETTPLPYNVREVD